MNFKHYIKFYLVNDVILSVILIATGVAWYELIGKGKDQTNAVEQESMAELVPLKIDETDPGTCC
ncbi:MAG: hypothetical protein AAF410_03555, partial [Pseudomonadota bacterium]